MKFSVQWYLEKLSSVKKGAENLKKVDNCSIACVLEQEKSWQWIETSSLRISRKILCPKITLQIILFPSKFSYNLRTGVAEEHFCLPFRMMHFPLICLVKILEVGVHAHFRFNLGAHFLSFRFTHCFSDKQEPHYCGTFKSQMNL